MTEEFEIGTADPFGAEAVRLVARLSAELAAIYPEDVAAGSGDFRPEDAAGSRSIFLVARLAGRPVGCAALRPMEPGVAEFKRLYVEPDVRVRGIARRLVTALEQHARAFGYTSIKLETGLRQPGSIRACESAGYKRIPNYGIYAGNPQSVCFEKKLNAP